MKTIAFIEEGKSKKFKSDVLEFMDAFFNNNNYKEITKDDIKNETCIDYVVVNCNTGSKVDTLKCKYCLANMDKLLKKDICIEGSLITYGFGNKNTVTVSSVEDENQGFVYCLQRYINVNSEHKIEPQEIPISIKFENEEELYKYMVVITMALIENVRDKNCFNKLIMKYRNNNP